MSKQVVAAMGTPFAAIRGIPASEAPCIASLGSDGDSTEVLPNAQQAGVELSFEVGAQPSSIDGDLPASRKKW